MRPSIPAQADPGDSHYRLMHKKPCLPEKTCPVCGRPFAWRKKWRNNWDSVVSCSERCQPGRRR